MKEKRRNKWKAKWKEGRKFLNERLLPINTSFHLAKNYANDPCDCSWHVVKANFAAKITQTVPWTASQSVTSTHSHSLPRSIFPLASLFQWNVQHLPRTGWQFTSIWVNVTQHLHSPPSMAEWRVSGPPSDTFGKGCLTNLGGWMNLIGVNLCAV